MTKISTETASAPHIAILTSEQMRGATLAAFRNFMQDTAKGLAKMNRSDPSLALSKLVLNEICEHGRARAVVRGDTVHIRSFPSIDTIAEKTLLSHRTVRRCIRFLERAIGLRVERKRLKSNRATGQYQTKNHYEIELMLNKIDQLKAAMQQDRRSARERLAYRTGNLGLLADADLVQRAAPSMHEATKRAAVKAEFGIDSTADCNAARAALQIFVPNFHRSQHDDIIETHAREVLEIVNYIIHDAPQMMVKKRAGFVMNQLKRAAVGDPFHRRALGLMEDAKGEISQHAYAQMFKTWEAQTQASSALKVSA